MYFLVNASLPEPFDVATQVQTLSVHRSHDIEVTVQHFLLP